MLSKSPFSFSGEWQSEYVYPSSGRKKNFEGKHLVKAHQTGNNVVFESISGQNESYLFIRVTIDDHIATGTWQESTNPEGYYAGAVYHGAIQLIISDDGKSMKGKWVGFGKDGEVNTGPWEMHQV